MDARATPNTCQPAAPTLFDVDEAPTVAAPARHSGHVEQVCASRAAYRLKQLMALGMSQAAIVESSGLPQRDIAQMLCAPNDDSGWVSIDVERAILAIVFDLDSLADDAQVPSDGTVRRLEALATLGWSRSEVARRLGISPGAVRWMIARPTVSVRRAREVRQVYDDLSSWYGPCTRLRGATRRRRLPAALDPAGIDLPSLEPRSQDIDPVLVERLVRGDAIDASRAERDMAILRLAALGRSDCSIADQLAISKRTVMRVRARHGAAAGARAAKTRAVSPTSTPQGEQADPQRVAAYCAGEQVELANEVEQASAAASYLRAGWEIRQIAGRMGIAPIDVEVLLRKYGIPRTTPVTQALRRFYLQEVPA